eukprot:jgi/Botrbrau1/670/Bobra.0161s0053.2
MARFVCMLALFVSLLSCASAQRTGRRLLDAGPYNVNSNKEFEFHGEGGHYYNLASEPGVFQLSTQLKPAVMFDHKGTYMRGIALQQKSARVVVATGPDFEEDISVAVNGEVLKIEDAVTQSTKRSIPAGDGTMMEVNWQRFAPGIGPMVEISTASIKLSVSLTAPFTDAGGVLQPNYLNANVTLIREPSQDLQGILGETYNTLRSGSATQAAPKYPLFDDSKYELKGYFGAPLVQTVASLAKKLAVQKPATSVSR